jgi:exodeoxyribonuclease V alpha subunit
VLSYTTVLPATIQGIRRYVGSGLTKGIGPVLAERIVEHFGLETLEVIEDEPGRLVEVPGLRRILHALNAIDRVAEVFTED